ncbi:MAG: hypothetical protein E4H01_17055 [Lysobacterales bacterium]|nr:MAG: hypothetical protein E4H01_17055 [Xanthomonadales bacterium]
MPEHRLRLSRQWGCSFTVRKRKPLHRVHACEIKVAQQGAPADVSVGMADNLWELRSRLPSGVARTFFTVYAGEIVLLHGFVKRSQRPL